ncbi:hypothetical protein T265_10990 [Opisthorchis viverrini]|uniref:Headcase middle domain-containing protein n=1 Tax=Opisthorchis viverrini TaxID=6198 RepID=A0A074Z4K6_OPIVI|nr:hypothetical protein T265_10990 [Opisthorchis viverrini]KER20457.1 hypothetical protein T265_10990 [Opisthorchis viverrini]
MSAIPGCASSPGLSSVDSVSTIWSTHSVNPSLSSNAEFQSVDRHCFSPCQKPEASSVNSYHSSVLTTRNPWSEKLAGIHEAVFNGVGHANSSTHVGFHGEVIGFRSCAAPGGICHAFQGTRTFDELDLPFTTVRVTCATAGCNYGGPLHQACLQRWNSCCELKCLLSINTQRLSAASTSVSDDQQHMLTAVRDENNSSAATIEELFSLYQCPRCGQCSLFRTSSEGRPFPIDEDPHASMLNVIQYVNRQLNANPTAARALSSHALPTQSTQAFTLGNIEGSCVTNAGVPGFPNFAADSASLQASLLEERQAGWQQAWKTCPPTIARHSQKVAMMRQCSDVIIQSHRACTSGVAVIRSLLRSDVRDSNPDTTKGQTWSPVLSPLLWTHQNNSTRTGGGLSKPELRQPDKHSSPGRCNINESRRDKQTIVFHMWPRKCDAGMSLPTNRVETGGFLELVTTGNMWFKVLTIAHHKYGLIDFTMISPFLIKMVYSHGAHASSFCESQISGPVSGMVDSGLSSVAHSIDSSRRSSDNTCNYDTSVDMGHDDGCWSAPPAGPRPVRGAGHSMSVSGLKTDNYFTFEPLSPLQSESPTSAVCGSNETKGPSEVKPVFSSPRHQNKQHIEIEKIVNESLPTSGTTGSLSVGRKHNPVSGGGLRGLSFWPSEKYREAPNDPSDRRKVVNRKGNIFQPRMSFNVFEKLPAYKRNPYFIHMDDDSCTGNEDTRAFLLAQLTNHRVSEVCCIICHQALVIYDHFPVIDGLFFISPICHRAGRASGLRVSWHTNGIAPTFYQNTVVGANCDPEQLIKNEQAQKLLSSSKSVIPPPGCLGPRQQLSVSHLSDQAATGASSYRNHAHPPRQERYLHAVCMGCMHNSITEQEAGGTRAHCRNCNRPWSGPNVCSRWDKLADSTARWPMWHEFIRSHLLVGGLYTYDVFAAFLCCSKQLTCNACESRLDVRENLSQGSCSIGEKLTTTATQASSSSSLQRIEDRTPQDPSFNAQTTAETMSATFDNLDDHPTSFPLPFFSQYSQLITCLFCAKVDYHFVKPFEKRFRTQRCSSN